MSDQQYRFRDDGHWWDEWNSKRDDEEQTPGFEIEWQEAILFDGFCGCGSPNRIVDAMIEYLSQDDKMLGCGEGLDQLMLAYWADSAGLTEHGTSVFAAWLTPAGRRWLELAS